VRALISERKYPPGKFLDISCKLKFCEPVDHCFLLVVRFLVSSMDCHGKMKVFHNDKGLFSLLWLIVVLFQESCPMGKRERGAERAAEEGSDNKRQGLREKAVRDAARQVEAAKKRSHARVKAHRGANHRVKDVNHEAEAGWQRVRSQKQTQHNASREAAIAQRSLDADDAHLQPECLPFSYKLSS